MLLRELRQHKEVPLSPGGQTRDFLYVADAVDALHRAAQLALDGVYNICSGLPVTVGAFAQAMAQAAGAAPALLQFGKLPYRPQELMWAVGDPQRFHAAAGWRPRWTLSDGLAALTREAT